MRQALTAAMMLVLLAPGNADATSTKSGRSLAQIRMISAEIAGYRKANSRVPLSIEELAAWEGTTKMWRFDDPWGHRLVYRPTDSAQEGFELYPPGPNGLDEQLKGDDLPGRAPNRPISYLALTAVIAVTLYFLGRRLTRP